MPVRSRGPSPSPPRQSGHQRLSLKVPPVTANAGFGSASAKTKTRPKTQANVGLRLGLRPKKGRFKVVSDFMGCHSWVGKHIDVAEEHALDVAAGIGTPQRPGVVAVGGQLATGPAAD